MGQVLPFDAHDAAVRRVEACDDAQQGRLAAAARAEERRQRPGGHLERDVVERHGVAEALGDGFDVDAHAAGLPCQASRLRSVSVSVVSTISAAKHSTTAPT